MTNVRCLCLFFISIILDTPGL